MSVFDRFFKLNSATSAELQKENAIYIITKAVNNKVTAKEAARIYDVISSKAMSLDTDEARIREGMNIITSMKADWFTKEEKENRLQELNALINKYSREKNESYLGKEVEVLLEGKSDKEGILMGYTDTMKLVNVEADHSLIGQIVSVKILDAKTWSLNGKLNK